MPDPAQRDIARRVSEELARRRMSRAALAAKAKISMSVLEKALAGQRRFSARTLVRLEEALEITLEPRQQRLEAPDELGAYARGSVAWLEGSYLTLRPSATRVGAIYSYLTLIEWDETRGHLRFREVARTDRDYAQQGDVAVPHQSGHIYLSTNRHGQQRLMVLRRQVRSGDLRGLLLTLHQVKGAHLQPAAMPVALLPVALLTEAPSLGTITPNHKAYDDYKARLDATLADGFAVVL